MSLYDELKAAGCRIENHGSDLYTPDTTKARDILHDNNANFYPFISPLSGDQWLDVPFMFQPYWDNITKRKQR